MMLRLWVLLVGFALFIPNTFAQTEGIKMGYFPSVTGRNINNVRYELPSEFEGEYNIVLMAFTQEQQFTVNTWLNALRALETEQSSVRVYELPTLTKQFNWAQRRMIDYWMDNGISDRTARHTTITLYTDLRAIQDALGYRDMATIQVYLVDRQGKVYWESEGVYSASKFDSLKQTLTTLTQPA